MVEGNDKKSTQELDMTSSSALIELIGGYAIQREIGGGGAGRVYLCRDLDLARDVAIKILHEDLLVNDVAVQRFTREAQVLARIDSKHVVKIYQAGMRDKVPYIVMENVEGKNAEDILKADGKLDVARALAAARDTALGLADAHKAGVIHRDVKPSNIILPSQAGQGAKLTDFGLAAEVEGSAKLTMAGSIPGTAAFLAPERVRGKSDARSDIYSLGCTLYTLIAGKPPFVRDVPIEVITAHLNDIAPRLECGRPDVADLVARMMAKDPDNRPQTADDVVRALDMLILDDGVPDGGRAANLAKRLEEVLGEGIPPAPTIDDVVAAEIPAPAPAIATGVTGSLRRMGVPELLQTLERSASTASVALAKLDGTEGFMGVRNGRLVFARCVHSSESGGTKVTFQGDEAFFELVTWREGHFQIQYDREPSETNVDASTQGLLLEAFRRLDESAPHTSAASTSASAGSAGSASAGSTSAGIASASVASVADVGNITAVQDVVTRRVSPTAATVVPATSSGSGSAPSAAKTGIFGSQTYGNAADARIDAPINETRPLGVEAPGARDVAEAPVDATRPLGVEKPDFSPHAPKTQPDGNDLGAIDKTIDTTLDKTLDGTIDRTIDTSLPHRLSTPTPTFSERAAPFVSGGKRVALQMRESARARWHDMTPRARAITAATGGALVVLIIVAAFAGGDSANGGKPEVIDDDRMERIAEGKAKEVLQEIAAIPPTKVTPVDELVRGHALAATGDEAGALGSFLRAAKGGETDDASLALVMKAINKSPADEAIEVLAAWPRDDIRPRLETTVAQGEWWERHHALIALEKRKEASNVDVTALAIRDLKEGPTCNKRKHGLTMLREAGKGAAALKAIEEASKRRDNNECMRHMDYSAAKQSVNGRP